MADETQETTQETTQSTLSDDELKAKYGKIYGVSATISPDDDTTVSVEYIFKRPSVASYDRYVKTASNGMTKALQQFILDSVTDEYEDKLKSDLEEYPALAITIGEKLLAMMGLSKDINLKKL